MTPLIAGNWKMNGLGDSRREIESLCARYEGACPAGCEVLICPPATLLREFASAFGDEGVIFGGQDCHAKADGPHTGDISATMLADAGAAYVIVGHSERRADHAETDALVRAKAEAAQAAGLVPIVCVGETEPERRSGQAEAVVERQLEGSLPHDRRKLVVAYEPVWAIGTGVTPTLADIEAMHGAIRRVVGEGVRLLYGGSVKPSNAREILAVRNVDGALVGGASLKADDFGAIIDAVGAA